MGSVSLANIAQNHFNDAAQVIYKLALEATVQLLKSKGENCYVAFEDYDVFDPVDTISENDIPIRILGIGLDESSELIVAACVKNVGYGCAQSDFDSDWTSVSSLYSNCYPDLYRFVVGHIDVAMTRTEADKIIRHLCSEEK